MFITDARTAVVFVGLVRAVVLLVADVLYWNALVVGLALELFLLADERTRLAHTVERGVHARAEQQHSRRFHSYNTIRYDTIKR